jgi:hypothetical protein
MGDEARRAWDLGRGDALASGAALLPRRAGSILRRARIVTAASGERDDEQQSEATHALQACRAPSSERKCGVLFALAAAECASISAFDKA